MAEARAELPHVTIHYAQTLDGRIATCTGHSQWISCPATLELAHRLRAEHAAVMVGIGTVLADNPRLTVRLVRGPSPRRVVVDSLLRIPPDAAVLSDGAALTIVATTERAPRERMRAVADRGADVLVLPQDADGRVDLTAALAALVERGVDSLLIEGGRGLITATLRGRLAERILVCIAPKIVGTGIDAIGDLHIRHMDKAVTFRDTSFRQVGDDIIFEGVLADPVTGAISG